MPRGPPTRNAPAERVCDWRHSNKHQPSDLSTYLSMLCKMRSVARMLAGLATVAFVAAESQPLRFAERVSGAVIGSLVADSLCLGSHYEYDAKKIAKA